MTKATANPWKEPPASPIGMAVSLLRALGVRDPAPQKFTTHRPGEWIADLPIPKQFVAGILEDTQTDFVASAGQLERLADYSQSFEAIHSKMVCWSPATVSDRVRAAETNIADLSEETRLQTREAAHAEALWRRRGLKEQLRKITLETTEIASEICQRLQSAATDFAKSREKQERAEAEKFGIDFQPSALLVTAWQMSWRLAEDLPDPVLCQSPAQVLKTLPIDLPITK